MATAAVLRLPTLSLTATPQLQPQKPRPTRRRTTPEQGRALEALGHAIEYLVDSRLIEGGTNDAESGAIRMMMACSRQIFEESLEIAPVSKRVQDWVQERLRRRSA